MQLTLPRALREAKNRQQLSSLALLGQEFWRYPMASPKPSASTSPTTQLNTDSSGIGTTVFSNNISNAIVNHQPNQQHKNVLSLMTHNVNNNNNNSNTPTAGGPAAVFSPTSNPLGVFSQAGTPSDTASSLSSFTSTGQQILSPESIDSVALTMSPVDSCRTGIVGKTSTFKTQNRKSMDIDNCTAFTTSPLVSTDSSEVNLRSGTRPTPPSTLNLGPLR